MAHELEIKKDGRAAMFSVKETPWHNLGHVVMDAPSLEDVLKLAGLDWTVSLRNLFLSDGKGNYTMVEKKAIVRDTDNQVYGYVTGQKYEPLQNAKALEFFRKFEESGLVKFETAGSLRMGQKIWILARIVDKSPTGEIEIAKGDTVRKYLMLSNAHDGLTGIRVGFTPIRVVCANTLAIAHSDKESKLLRILHNRKTADTLKAVQEVVSLASQSFEATAEQYRSLVRKQVNKNDVARYVTQVFYNGAQAESDREKIARERLNDDITRIFETGYGNTNPAVAGTAYALYNAATQYLSYDKGRNQETRLDSLWFGQGRAVNEDALKVALAL
jgi:phage/plasmid-like protein (TIGR03299 family)